MIRPLRRIATGFLTCLVGLALWSVFFSTFVPSSTGTWTAIAGATCIGAICATLGYRRAASHTPTGGAWTPKQPVLDHPIFIALCVGGATGWVVFEALSGGGLALWTITTGEPATATLHLGAYRTASRFNCDGFDLQEAPFKPHRVVCANYRYGQAPPPRTRVVVMGPASRFGIDVQSFQIGE